MRSIYIYSLAYSGRVIIAAPTKACNDGATTRAWTDDRRSTKHYDNLSNLWLQLDNHPVGSAHRIHSAGKCPRRQAGGGRDKVHLRRAHASGGI
jgi:hypothetical protein